MNTHTQIHLQTVISRQTRLGLHHVSVALAALALAGVGALARTLTSPLVPPVNAAGQPRTATGSAAHPEPTETVFRRDFRPGGLLAVPRDYVARRAPYLGRRL